jgi:ribosomal protein L32
MSKSKWQEYKEKNGATALDFLNPQTRRTTDEVSDQRMSMCNECPELIKITKQCKKCGCFMLAKTKLEIAKCPIGKW